MSIIDIINTEYGIEVVTHTPQDTTDEVVFLTTSEGKYVLKKACDPHKPEIIRKVSEALEKANILSSWPRKTLKGKFCFDYNGQSYFVRRYVPGIAHNALGSLLYIREYGAFLARIHKSVAELKLNLSEMEIQKQVIDKEIPLIRKYFNDPILDDVLSILQKDIAKISVMDKQLIHRDYHWGNILFMSGKPVGIIDWDSLMNGYPIYDIAYFLAELLVHAPNIDICEVKRLFLEGYQTERDLSATQMNFIHDLMLVVHIDFAAWFIESGDLISAKESLKHLRKIFNLECE